MTALLHAATRRELLIGSGALFAWAYAPRLARAEGRDPRFLTIVLRGALDGLAAVAPVGDPDWVGLRGDKALTLKSATPGLPLHALFAPHPADADPAPPLHQRRRHHRARGRDSLPGALPFRRPGRARKRRAAA